MNVLGIFSEILVKTDGKTERRTDGVFLWDVEELTYLLMILQIWLNFSLKIHAHNFENYIRCAKISNVIYCKNEIGGTADLTLKHTFNLGNPEIE